MPNWGNPQYLSDEAKLFLRLTHEGFRDGDWSFVAQKTQKGEYLHRPVRKSNLKRFCDTAKIDDACNIYLSASSFSGGKTRQSSSLFAMHSMVADIDCHSKALCLEARNQQLNNLIHVLKHGSDYGLLEPNYIVHTGRGIQVWWRHEEMSVGANRWTWDSVARRLDICLRTILHDLGKDPVDGCPDLRIDSTVSFNPTSLYRLPGTTNQNTGKQVFFEILHEHLYSLAELKAFRDEIPLPPVQFVPKQAKDHRAWAKQMLVKLYSLRELRNADEGEELRNNFCFVVYCTLRAAGYNKDKALDLVGNFNQSFKVPLRESELTACLSSAVRKHYKLSTKVIIELLQISQDEQLSVGIGTNLKKREAKRRAQEKQRKLKERNAKIVSMYKTGEYTQESLGALFGISGGMVEKIMRAADPGYYKRVRDAAAKERNAKIIALYNKNCTYKGIADELGCGFAVVCRTLQKYNHGEMDTAGNLIVAVADSNTAAAAAAAATTVPSPASSEESAASDEGASFYARHHLHQTDGDNNGCLRGTGRLCSPPRPEPEPPACGPGVPVSAVRWVYPAVFRPSSRLVPSPPV